MELVHRAIVAQGCTHLFPAVIAQGIEHVQITADKRGPALHQVFLRQGCVVKDPAGRLHQPQRYTSIQQASGSTFCQPEGTGHLCKCLPTSRQMGKEPQFQRDVKCACGHEAQPQGVQGLRLIRRCVGPTGPPGMHGASCLSLCQNAKNKL